MKYIKGIIVYFILISNQQFSLGIVWLIFVLYGWTIISILVQSYSLQSFIYALCGFGIIIAITLFFMNGVEEVPFPKGAVLFKLDGIAQALVVFFIFTIHFENLLPQGAQLCRFLLQISDYYPDVFDPQKLLKKLFQDFVQV